MRTPHVTADEMPTIANAPPTEGMTVPPKKSRAPTCGDRFELGERIGHGGMGEVRLAHDARFGRDVAVKLLRGEPHRAATNRFLREARVQGRLDHPAIVPVYDMGIDDSGTPYFAMKRLTGVTLHAVLEQQAAGDAEMLARWSRRLLLARLVEVCLAIEFAHTRGVVHRDLKPGNIMLGEFGEVYVIDWGIARMTASDIDSVDPEDQTVAGAMIGTPGYAPPEQVRGTRVDHRADIYALGCILFEVLTGRAPLPRGKAGIQATLAASAHHPRVRHPEVDVPPELDELCAFATAPSKHRRLGSARELAAGIQRYLDGDRDHARRQELADEYVTVARAAVADGDRAHGMQAAGRALALNPADARAQELVGHLLLSPPAETPPEVERELEQQAARSGRLQLRAAVGVYALFLLAMPVLLALGVGRPTWILAIMGAIALNLAGFTYAATRERPLGSLIQIGLVLHCGSLALAGFVLGPLPVLPALAVGSVAAFLSQPLISARLTVIGAHLAAVLGPVALELAGITPRTFTFEGSGLHLQPWAVDMSAPALLAIALAATVMQVIATSILVIQVRRARDSAERQTAVQLWHLRQLAHQ